MPSVRLPGGISGVGPPVCVPALRQWTSLLEGVITECRAGASGGEAAPRTAECSAEVMEGPKVMARHSLIAARMLTRAERNQQLDGAAQQSRQAPEPSACELPRRNGRPRSRGRAGCSAGARTDVRRIFRVPQRASPMPTRTQFLR